MNQQDNILHTVENALSQGNLALARAMCEEALAEDATQQAVAEKLVQIKTQISANRRAQQQSMAEKVAAIRALMAQGSYEQAEAQLVDLPDQHRLADSLLAAQRKVNQALLQVEQAQDDFELDLLDNAQQKLRDILSWQKQSVADLNPHLLLGDTGDIRLRLPTSLIEQTMRLLTAIDRRRTMREQLETAQKAEAYATIVQQLESRQLLTLAERDLLEIARQKMQVQAVVTTILDDADASFEALRGAVQTATELATKQGADQLNKLAQRWLEKAVSLPDWRDAEKPLRNGEKLFAALEQSRRIRYFINLLEDGYAVAAEFPADRQPLLFETPTTVRTQLPQLAKQVSELLTHTETVWATLHAEVDKWQRTLRHQLRIFLRSQTDEINYLIEADQFVAAQKVITQTLVIVSDTVATWLTEAEVIALQQLLANVEQRISADEQHATLIRQLNWQQISFAEAVESAGAIGTVAADATYPIAGWDQFIHTLEALALFESSSQEKVTVTHSYKERIEARRLPAVDLFAKLQSFGDLSDAAAIYSTSLRTDRQRVVRDLQRDYIQLCADIAERPELLAETGETAVPSRLLELHEQFRWVNAQPDIAVDGAQLESHLVDALQIVWQVAQNKAVNWSTKHELQTAHRQLTNLAHLSTHVDVEPFASDDVPIDVATVRRLRNATATILENAESSIPKLTILQREVAALLRENDQPTASLHTLKAALDQLQKSEIQLAKIHATDHTMNAVEKYMILTHEIGATLRQDNRSWEWLLNGQQHLEQRASRLAEEIQQRWAAQFNTILVGRRVTETLREQVLRPVQSAETAAIVSANLIEVAQTLNKSRYWGYIKDATATPAQLTDNAVISNEWEQLHNSATDTLNDYPNLRRGLGWGLLLGGGVLAVISTLAWFLIVSPEFDALGQAATNEAQAAVQARMTAEAGDAALIAAATEESERLAATVVAAQSAESNAIATATAIAATATSAFEAYQLEGSEVLRQEQTRTAQQIVESIAGTVTAIDAEDSCRRAADYRIELSPVTLNPPPGSIVHRLDEPVQAYWTITNTSRLCQLQQPLVAQLRGNTYPNDIVLEDGNGNALSELLPGRSAQLTLTFEAQVVRRLIDNQFIDVAEEWILLTYFNETHVALTDQPHLIIDVGEWIKLGAP